MRKGLLILSVWVLLGITLSTTWAGPSHVITCMDVSRETRLELFDFSPHIKLLNVRGKHNQLPPGMTAFVIEQSDIALVVMRYQPYEIELQPSLPAGTAPPSIVTDNAEKASIGVLDRVIVENHSSVKVSEQRRKGAAILVLSSGLRLHFNNCEIQGDVSVLNWEKTFKPQPVQ